MGAYLSEPVTEKFSTDETSEYIDVGASSMQGWRISQEDAHNSILNFDENVSFFAVYDGHGGAEVATYCAEKLPEFLKNLKAYKEGNFEQALKDAFLDFDQTLLQDDVIEILKQLAGEKNPDRESELAEEEEEEDLTELCQEGSLPLDQVLEKYKGALVKFDNVNKMKDEAVASNSSRNSRVKCNESETDEPSCSFAFQKKSNKEKNVESDDVDVSSSNVENEESATNAETEKKESSKTSNLKENGGIVKCTSPDSSSTNCKDLPTECSDKLKTNGEINSVEEGNSGKSEGVSSTSSSPSRTVEKQENGGISSPSSSSSSSYRQNSCVKVSASCSSGSRTEDYPGKKATICQMSDEDSSSEEYDVDFHAEENSSTEDGEEDCEPCDDETEEENEDEDEEAEDEESLFCANMIEEPGKDSGCTAVIALLHGKDLYVANAGDSRCVLCRAGEAIEMSLDHKPEDEKERSRIYKAGGKVTMDGRVNGGLNLSRAIGDHAYKMNKDLPPEKQMISALPDIKKVVITPEDEFMILACDGIWNYMSSEDVVQFIKERLEEGRESISKICEELFDTCLAPHTIGDGTGCDNMTAVIVRFKQPKILDLPTKLPDESGIEVTTVTSKKRTISTSSENENDDTLNSCKRVKTDTNNQGDEELSKVEKCDSIDNTISTSSTTPLKTDKTLTTTQNKEEKLTSTTTTT